MRNFDDFDALKEASNKNLESKKFPGLFYRLVAFEELEEMVEISNEISTIDRYLKSIKDDKDVDFSEVEKNDKRVKELESELYLWFFQNVPVDEENDLIPDMQTIKEIRKQKSKVVNDMFTEYVALANPKKKKGKKKTN